MTLPEFPLFRREFIGTLRTGRAFWLLFALCALSCFLALTVWPSGTSYLFRRSEQVFLTYLWSQLGLGILIVPALTVGSIAGERERGTWELLYATHLAPLEIALSKLGAAFLYACLLLLAPAPGACLLYLLGGMTFASLAWSYAVAFATFAMTSLVCLAVSIRSDRTSNAAVRGMLWTLFYSIGLSLLLLLFMGLVGGDRSGAEFFGSFNPFYPLLALQEDDATWPTIVYLGYAGTVTLGHFVTLLVLARQPENQRRTGPRRFGELPRELVSPPPPAVTRMPPSSAATASSTTGESTEPSEGGGGPPPLASTANAGARAGPRRTRPRAATTRWLVERAEGRSFFGPVFQKELLTEPLGGRKFRGIFFFIPLLVGLLVCLAVESGDWHEMSLPVNLALLTLVLLVLPAVAAGSLPREEEQGNLDLLRMSLLRGSEVLWGKLLASIWAVSGLFTVGVILHCVTGLLAMGEPRGQSGWWESRGPFTGLYIMGMVVFPAACFTAMLTLAAASFCKRTLTALLTTYLALAALVIFFPLLIGISGGGDGLEHIHPYAVIVQNTLSFKRDASVGPFFLANAIGTLGLWGLALGATRGRFEADSELGSPIEYQSARATPTAETARSESP